MWSPNGRSEGAWAAGDVQTPPKPPGLFEPTTSRSSASTRPPSDGAPSPASTMIASAKQAIAPILPFGGSSGKLQSDLNSAAGSPSGAKIGAGATRGHPCFPPGDFSGLSPASGSDSQPSPLVMPPGLATLDPWASADLARSYAGWLGWANQGLLGLPDQHSMAAAAAAAAAAAGFGGAFATGGWGCYPQCAEDIAGYPQCAGAEDIAEEDVSSEGLMQMPFFLGQRSEPYRPGEMFAKVSYLGGDSDACPATLAPPGSASGAVPPLSTHPVACSAAAPGAFVPLFDQQLDVRGDSAVTPDDAGGGHAKASEAIRGERSNSAVVDPAVGDDGEEDSEEDDEESRKQQQGVDMAISGGVGPPSVDNPHCPTVGSLGHGLRLCKPCAFVNSKGCKDGVDCRFCHLCGPGEKKRRKKEKSAFWRTVNRWPHEDAPSWP